MLEYPRMNNWISAVFSPTGGCSSIATAIAGARIAELVRMLGTSGPTAEAHARGLLSIED